MTKQVYDGMVDRGWGRIINVSSVNGSEGRVRADQLLRRQSRHARLHQVAGLEVARKGVTVNTISPGYIGTKMVTAIPKDVLDSKILPQIPISRLGKPEEVAGLIIYLCSRRGSLRHWRQHRHQRWPAHAIGAPADAGSRQESAPVDKAMLAPGAWLCCSGPC